MKKITVLGLVLILLSGVASAQVQGIRTRGYNSARVTRPEKFQLKKDMLRSNVIQRNARRDGIITPLEKRRIYKAKCKTRRDVVRSRHNGRNRIL